MTEPAESQMICAVCGRVLDTYTVPDQPVRYMHSMQDRLGGEDHIAVPISTDEASLQLRARCDFCNVDHPVWVIPAHSFEMPGPVEGAMSSGDWAACNACYGLIRNGHWDSLVRRAASYSSLRPILGTFATRDLLRKLYTKLKRNMYGEPYRINQDA